MVKKDSLIKGTLILAAAALIARMLGIFQRVPLAYMVGTDGGVYFGIANTVYLYLLIIATAGIPSAVSKMVSERYALGKPAEADRIFRAALLFGAVTGVILAALLFVLAPLYSTYIARTPGAELSIRAIAPALLLFPLIAMMRGYFQGRQMMAAGGISQIVEQILRVVLGIGIALIVLSLGWGDSWVSAAATFGSVFGSIGAFVVMLWYARKLRAMDAKEAAVTAQNNHEVAKLPFLSIYKEILTMSLPVVITAMTVQFLYLIDSSFFIRFTSSFYDSADAAKQSMNALIYNAQSIAGIPPILAIALSQSIIPILSAAYSVRNMSEVQRQASLVMRIVVFTGVPVALVLTVAATSVNGLLFTSVAGSGLVAALTAGTIVQITTMTSNSILFGLGKPRAAMIHTLIGFAVKIVGSMLLAPLLGGYGLVLASTLCFVFISTMNLRSINKIIKLRVLQKKWAPYLFTIVITSAAGFGVEVLIRNLLEGVIHAKFVYLLSSMVTGVVAGGLYIVLLVLTKAITANEAASFPGPLRKLLLPLVRRLGGRKLSEG